MNFCFYERIKTKNKVKKGPKKFELISDLLR